jgi:pyridoxamine 5'-phosphate oxidase
MQSQVVASREELHEAYRDLEAKFNGVKVPRPRAWGGWRLTPESVEFWQGQPNRLHDRVRYVREGEGWRTERLAP